MKATLDYDDMTVAEIVTQNIRTADIFKKNGIDFCCGGNISVQEICQKKNINYITLKKELLNIDQPSTTQNYDSWALDFMVDYIINTHHKYVTEANELVLQYATKVAKVHGHHYTEVVEIFNLFKEIARELNTHMHKEEMVLFPYIKQLVRAENNKTTISLPPFGTISNPIRMMEAEHDNAGGILKEIERLSNNFTPPAEACNTFRALYAKLEAYQNDLFEHVHLENNILFPKAVELEAKLLKNQI